ncbi:hypothetical protein [Flavobacterium sp. ZS1P14]|uniref:hypothetical protein n=1 Tax=Flavobacterium sp. ZS1P14 TaxID=3401729 RepID=UPI003AAF3D3B
MAAENYSPRTFNKCMYSVKYFFKFLIDIEEIDMKNPMRNYVPKEVLQSTIESVSKTEFELILVAVDNNDPIMKLGGKGEKKKTCIGLI